MHICINANATNVACSWITNTPSPPNLLIFILEALIVIMLIIIISGVITKILLYLKPK